MSELTLSPVTTRASVEAVLSTLAYVDTPTTLIHVGAGDGQGSIHVWQQWSVPSVLLIDADTSQMHWVQELGQGNVQVQVQEAVLGDEAGQADFYQPSLPSEQSLIHPDALKTLWANLELEQVTPRTVTTLDDVAQRVFELQPTKTWLLIDCFGASMILRGAAQTLAQAQVVCIRCLLAEEISDALQADSLASIEAYLREAGFTMVASLATKHPGIGYAIFIRRADNQSAQAERLLEEAQTRAQALEDEVLSLKSESQRVHQQHESLVQEMEVRLASKTYALEEMKSELSRQRQAAQNDVESAAQAKVVTEQREAEVTQLKKTIGQLQTSKTQLQITLSEKESHAAAQAEKLTTLQTEVTQLQGQLAKQQAADAAGASKQAQLQKSLVAAEEKIKLDSQALASAETQISELKAEVATLKKQASDLQALSSKVEALFSQQKTYIQQTSSALGQHVARIAKSQRDHQSLLQYMQNGQWAVDTALSPEFAKSLIELREANQYDVVLIFGSSAATELLAYMTVRPQLAAKRLSNGHAQAALTSDAQPTEVVEASSADLPQSILSFEHQRQGCEKLKQRLKTLNCLQAVEVIHAPWVNGHAQDDKALFYACDRSLNRIYNWLNPDASVLVVLGDELTKANHSRALALVTLLQQLPTQTIDLVWQPTDCAAETELATEWRELLESRQRRSESLTVSEAQGLRVLG